MKSKHLVGLAALLAALGVSAPVQPQYPTKPIRLIVPFAAGGATDIVARIIQPKLSVGLGQPVVIDNRGGSASIIGTELAAKAAPDGYTVVMIGAAHAINVSIYNKLPYDSVKDFAPVIMVDFAPQMLVVHPALPVNSVKELIQLAKSRPGHLNFGAGGGVGSASYFAGAMFNSMAGVDIVPVPYKGAGPALVDLLSGNIQLTISPLLPTVPHVKSGKLKALAVTSAKRVSQLPNLPAIAETIPGYEIISWRGVLAPARTPRAIVQRLNTEIGTVLRLPEIHKGLSEQGLQVVGGTPEQLSSYLRQDIERFTAISKQLGLRAEKP